MSVRKLTIGLLVYNENDFIDTTIKNIMSQSFNDFELIIANNASNDGSTEKIRKWENKDNRIKHICREKNIGALENWNDVVRRAKGELFVLAGGHDMWSENYLKNLVKTLDTNSDTILAFAKTIWVDHHGMPVKKTSSIIDTSSMSSRVRFVALALGNRNYMYGIIRTKELQQNTHLQLAIVGSGEILLQELLQFGHFTLVEGEYWYRRINRKNESRMKKLDRYKIVLFASESDRIRFIFLPHLQYCIIYLFLPFLCRKISISKRLNIIPSAIIVFIMRFPGCLYNDFKWLFYSIKRFIK